MGMLEWATKEVEIAIEREKKELGNMVDKDTMDYGTAIYKSALKAYQSLCEDNHTGHSIGITKYILNRLIDDKPLSPITEEDTWTDITEHGPKNAEFKTFQCDRMGGLFKYVFPDGRVEYSDVDRFAAIDIHTRNAYHFGLVSKLMDEMFPLELPYNPNSRAFKVYCEDFLVNPENGDFDTIGIFSVIVPTDDTKIDVYKYFAIQDDTKEWVEITKEQYDKRMELSKEVKHETAKVDENTEG